MIRNSILFVLFAIIAMSSFNSCKKDEFLDWKLMNKQWLVEHRDDKNFIETASGVQYRVIHKGEFDKPFVTSDKYLVQIKLEGWYITGEKDYFAAPKSDPTQTMLVNLRNLPQGLREVLRLMHQDAIYEVRIPQELGFGDKKELGIPPYSTLIYKITLKGVKI